MFSALAWRGPRWLSREQTHERRTTAPKGESRGSKDDAQRLGGNLNLQIELTPRQRAAWRWSIATWIGLIVLGLAWELVLAPLTPGGSWLALKVVPLLLPLPSMLRGSPYGMQVALLLVLLYVLEAGARIVDPAPARWLAATEFALSLAFFVSAVIYLRPFKRAALARRAAS